MSTINHQKLRELAFALQRMATPQKLLAFRAMLSPSAVLALLDELEHARTMAPAIRLTLHHEIADFCATLGSPCEPETPEAIQRELLQRINNVFDFSLTSKGSQHEQKDLVSRIHVGAGMRPRFSHSVCRTTPPNDFIRQLLPGIAGHFHCHAVPGRRCSPFQ